MNTLALYYRASKEKEDENRDESATIQNQRDLLRHYIQSRLEFENWNVLELKDDGESGTTFDRPGFQRLLELAGKEVQCIIVKDVSRLGRNLIEVGNYLDQVFPTLGVRFISVNEGYDSYYNEGRTIGLDISLKAMVYEMYSRDLSNKISSVKAQNMKKGRYTGSFPFYGYQKSSITKSGLEIDSEAANTVRRIFSLAANGAKTFQIAILLNKEGILPPLSYRKQKNPNDSLHCPTVTEHNIWTQHRISSIIRDERYTGVLISRKKQRIDITSNKTKMNDKADWIVVENALDPIVTKEEYEQAQKILYLREKRPKSSPELFKGLLKCGICGRALEKVYCKRPYYRCLTRRYQLDSMCAGIQIEKEELEQAVLLSLKRQIELIQKEESNKLTPETMVSQKIEKLNEGIIKCKSSQMILFENFAADFLDRTQFIAEKKKNAEHLSKLQTEKETLLQQLQSVAQPDKKYDLDQYAYMNSLSRELLTTLVHKIQIHPDHKIEIVWNFKSAEVI